MIDAKENNNFKITFKKKISVVGSKFDTTFLLSNLTSDSKKNLLKNFTKNVEIKSFSI